MLCTRVHNRHVYDTRRAAAAAARGDRLSTKYQRLMDGCVYINTKIITAALR